MISFICLWVSPVWGAIVCPVIPLLTPRRRNVNFLVCSAFYLLLGWSGDIQASYVLEWKVFIHFFFSFKLMFWESILFGSLLEKQVAMFLSLSNTIFIPSQAESLLDIFLSILSNKQVTVIFSKNLRMHYTNISTFHSSLIHHGLVPKRQQSMVV